ncbi:hypothetical protein PsorP6_015119 [Peronosclerospora sorghi]|uniref:Uncharacterized protein n=1 Tax=Peronosclerospora sorghi TaxID=230839 RepID=A0ACC0VSB5_9STRA|nr:hypothetical protein PsorP6_015119 [Peronosclerospora sorghi]
MSAVDDIEARILRLDETRAAKLTQLQRLQQDLRYSHVSGVDERLDSGLSVARLEVEVGAGRNLQFKTGFLSGQRTYVRVTVVVEHLVSKNTVMEQKVTTKRPVSELARWNEMLLFEGLPAAVGTIKVDVMQEEKFGADEVVGTFILPLARLQNQRRMEKWHVLEKNDQVTKSEVLVSCRFQRSPIVALEVELELAQNQANELHMFVGRNQNLVRLAMQEPTHAMPSFKPLQGKVVTPEETDEPTVSSRFSAVASFPPAMTKRELMENGDLHRPNVRLKRQRVDAEKHATSLSDKIAHWLLPTSNTVAEKSKQSGVFPAERPSMTSSEYFPFKHSENAPTSSRRPRRSGRSSRPSASHTLRKIENWLFTDKDGNPRDLPFGRPID